MRYYLGNCDFKWKHTSEHGNPKMEYIWVRRQLGEKLAKEIEQNNYELELVKTEGIVPNLFCKCHIFVHIKNKYEHYDWCHHSIGINCIGNGFQKKKIKNLNDIH